MSKFIEKLEAHLREHPEIKPSPLSIKAGLNESAVRVMLKRGKSPRMETATKICKALGFTFDEFMGGVSHEELNELYNEISDLSEDRINIVKSLVQNLREQQDHESVSDPE